VTAPDSPAVAAVRRLADGYRRLAEVDGDPIGAAADADALDGVLAELDEARRTIAAESPARPPAATESSGTGSCGSAAWGPMFALPQPDRSGSPEIDFKPRGHRPSATEPPEAPQTADGDLGPMPAPTERLRSAAGELERDGRWGGAADATTALAAWMRAEADRPTRRAWDDQVLYLAADLADQILGEVRK
jgi:hypothetical protein